MFPVVEAPAACLLLSCLSALEYLSRVCFPWVLTSTELQHSEQKTWKLSQLLMINSCRSISGINQVFRFSISLGHSRTAHGSCKMWGYLHYELQHTQFLFSFFSYERTDIYWILLAACDMLDFKVHLMWKNHNFNPFASHFSVGNSHNMADGYLQNQVQVDLIERLVCCISLRLRKGGQMSFKVHEPKWVKIKSIFSPYHLLVVIDGSKLYAPLTNK